MERNNNHTAERGGAAVQRRSPPPPAATQSVRVVFDCSAICGGLLKALGRRCSPVSNVAHGENQPLLPGEQRRSPGEIGVKGPAVNVLKMTLCMR